jgi:hypothetical protein
MGYKIAILLVLVFTVALALVEDDPAKATPLPVEVKGNASNAGTDYLSVPAAAFTPKSQSSNYENHGRYLKAFGSQAAFRAPVYLPHGASISRISACFFDDSNTTSGTLKLDYLQVGSGIAYEAASIVSSTSPSFQLSTTTTISPALVDNVFFAYWLELTLPASGGAGNDVWGCGVIIEYTRPATETGILSMPGAAFDHPSEDGYNVGQTQVGGKLKHFDDGVGTHGLYVAPVSLPNMAVVNKVTLYYYDNDVHQINFYLEKTRHNTIIEMVFTYSVDYANKVEVTDISGPTIDTDYYSYWAYVELAPANLELWAVTIEYTLHADNFGLLDIADAAFTPFYDGYDYQNHGRFLFHQHSEGGGTLDGVYVAPVYLPQGATINYLGAIYFDGSGTLNGNATLARSKLGSYEVLGSAPSSTSSEFIFSGQTVLADRIVDNSQYSYFVFWTLPVTAVHNPPADGDILGCRIEIGYVMIYYAYLPFVRK